MRIWAQRFDIGPSVYIFAILSLIWECYWKLICILIYYNTFILSFDLYGSQDHEDPFKTSIDLKYYPIRI